MLICITASGVCIRRPTVVHTHERLKANTSTRATAAVTPGTPPSGRKPRMTPTTIITTDAIR